MRTTAQYVIFESHRTELELSMPAADAQGSKAIRHR